MFPLTDFVCFAGPFFLRLVFKCTIFLTTIERNAIFFRWNADENVVVLFLLWGGGNNVWPTVAFNHSLHTCIAWVYILKRNCLDWTKLFSKLYDRNRFGHVPVALCTRCTTDVILLNCSCPAQPNAPSWSIMEIQPLLSICK